MLSSSLNTRYNNLNYLKQLLPFSMKNLLLFSFFIGFAMAATFSINSISTCTNTSASGFCTRWEQNGSVVQTTSCFPEITEVYILQNNQHVPKKISQIKIGDQILGVEGKKITTTKVLGWLHKKPEETAEYLSISTQSGQFLTSSHHNIALEDQSYIFAKNLLGKILYNGQKVIDVKSKMLKGVYAPMTSSGNFLVKVGSESKTLAHCFANIENPELYRPFVTGIWNVWQTIFETGSNYEMHPAAEWMMKHFSFLVEK